MKINSPASFWPRHDAEFGCLLDGVDGVAASVREPDNFTLTPSPAAGTRRSRCREMDGLCRGPWCPHCGHAEQIFGADKQDPRTWAKQPRSVRPYAMQSGKHRILT